ncbi:hypothetical protein AAE478_001348 [Parahypoxylon ruwenzoriense]
MRLQVLPEPIVYQYPVRSVEAQSPPYTPPTPHITTTPTSTPSGSTTPKSTPPSSITNTPCTSLSVSEEPTPLCLICERMVFWGKNEPTYTGCQCECRCKLQREEDDEGGLLPLCGDCLEQNRLNPRRHRPHGGWSKFDEQK